jgi:GntR family transcriptional repressor for pyruvate dehydrogenase complex
MAAARPAPPPDDAGITTPAAGLSPRGPSSKVTDAIIEAIRQDIVTGRLQRGDKLPNERGLAAHFGVSQPTVREAVRALDALGLVDVRQGSGAYVRGDGSYMLASALQTMLQMERVTILDVLNVRVVLGRESVRVAATAATDADLAALEARFETLSHPQELDGVAGIIDALSAFQTALSAAAHNPLLLAIEGFLVNLLLQIQASVMSQRGADFWSERSTRFQPDRRRILSALQDGDEVAAAAAMDAYLDHQRAAFVDDPEFSKLRLSDSKPMQAMSELVAAVRLT